MASLDRELRDQEDVVTEPIQVRPVRTTVKPAMPGGGGVRLGFKVDTSFPVIPNSHQVVRLIPRTTGTFEILNGTSGTARCTNIVPPTTAAS